VAKAQLGPHTTRPIDTTSLLVDLLDLLYKPGIGECPSTSHITETGKLAFSAEMIR
jgi:hypothetical protein